MQCSDRTSTIFSSNLVYWNVRIWDFHDSIRFRFPTVSQLVLTIKMSFSHLNSIMDLNTGGINLAVVKCLILYTLLRRGLCSQLMGLLHAILQFVYLTSRVWRSFIPGLGTHECIYRKSGMPPKHEIVGRISCSVTFSGVIGLHHGTYKGFPILFLDWI